MKSAGKEQVSVSQRLIALLRLFAEEGETLSIRDISTRLGIAPSSIHRLLAGLVDEHIIERTARRRYCVGREYARIGALAARKIDIRRLARPMMQKVAILTGETCLLGIMLPNARELMIVDKIDTLHPLRYKIRLHERRTLLWGATGRAVLAWLDAVEVRRVLESGARSSGNGDRPPSEASLANDLAKIRSAGYAITQGQRTAGAVGIAAPIFGAEGRIIGDLCVTIPDIRFRRREEQRYARIVMDEAHELSAALGHQGSPECNAKAALFRVNSAQRN